MSLKHSHHAMIRALASLSPSSIRGIADGADVRTRTEDMQEVNSIVLAYLEELMDDAIAHLPAGTPDSPDVVNAIWDAVNEDPDYDPIAWLARAGCHLDGMRAAA